MTIKNFFFIFLFFSLTFLGFFSFVNAQEPDNQTLVQTVREQIKALQTRIAEMQKELEQLVGQAEELEAAVQFTQTLIQGVENEEVKQLQELLAKDPEIYPGGRITGFFGFLTQQAVKKFQEKYADDILAPLGFKEGTGIVGSLTRAKLNELYGKAIPAVPAVPATPATPAVPGETPAVPAIPATPAIPTVATATTSPVIPPFVPAVPYITITSPNGGEQWVRGKTYDITWKSGLLGEVNIELASSSLPIGNIAYSVKSSQEKYSWTIPSTQPLGSLYKIFIWDAEGTRIDAQDYSDNYFSIVATSTIATTTTPTPTTTTPIIPISTTTTATTTTATTTQQTTTQTQTQTQQQTTIQTTTATTTTATTTVAFTVTSPNGGEQWTQGSAYPITWASTGGASTTRISLYQSGSFKEILAADASNTGSWNWAISSTLATGTQYQIRIFNLFYPNNYDDSNNYFSISTTTTASATTASATTTAATTTTAYPGFFMTTDKQSYSNKEIISLTIRRVDSATSSYYIDLYAVKPGENETTKITIQNNLNVSASSGVTIQINTTTTEPFKSGPSGSYLLLICIGGQQCGISIDTNGMAINYIADTIPPVISNIQVSNITQTSATISWATDEPSDSLVEYGLTGTVGADYGYGTLTPLNSFPVASHSVSLSGLQAGTLYHYRVYSADTYGNTAMSGDNVFTTLSPQSNQPQFLLKWGSTGSGDGQFSSSMGIAVDVSGNVYVTDSGASRIQKFTSDGTFIAKWGSFGSGDGQFITPGGIAVDVSGNVYVVDANAKRVQKFTSNGTFITKWGSDGSGNGQFITPRGIALDASGNVYVTDQYMYRIQKFTSNGTFITKWGSYGSGNGQFSSLYGIVVDNNGNVYVVDGAGRIQKFTSDGTFITKWGSQGSGDGQFNFPFGIALDVSGNVYVTDQNNHRVQKFTSSGTFIAKWGSQGSGDGQFNYPIGLAIDAGGNIYVADNNNYHIHKFAPGQTALLQQEHLLASISAAIAWLAEEIKKLLAR